MDSTQHLEKGYWILRDVSMLSCALDSASAISNAETAEIVHSTAMRMSHKIETYFLRRARLLPDDPAPLECLLATARSATFTA
jgi:hypothetical protein